MTLIYDLLSRITIFWSISSLLFEVGIWCVDLSWDGGEVHTIWGHFGLDMTSDIISMFPCLEHISYITNNFLQMCLILDQFLWGICHVTMTCLVC